MATKSRRPSFTPHPAPGNLRLVQDFISSRDPHADRDELASPAGLAAWMTRQGLAPPEAPVDETAWKNAIEVREGLRALLRAHNGKALAMEALEGLNRALAEARHGVAFERSTAARLVAPEAGWPGVLSRMLDAVFEAMVAGKWRRFKGCYEDKCQMAFYDASRNRLGKWCTVRRCGFRVNARTYRKRGPLTRRGLLG